MNIRANRRCVIYARVAAENTDTPFLLDQQANILRACAEEDWGLEVVSVCKACEHGTAPNRDSIQNLYKEIEATGAAYVVVQGPDRLCREQMGLFNITQELGKLGVKRLLLPHRESIRVPLTAVCYIPPWGALKGGGGLEG